MTTTATVRLNRVRLVLLESLKERFVDADQLIVKFPLHEIPRVLALEGLIARDAYVTEVALDDAEIGLVGIYHFVPDANFYVPQQPPPAGVIIASAPDLVMSVSGMNNSLVEGTMGPTMADATMSMSGTVT